VTPDGRFVAGSGERFGHHEAFVADLTLIAPMIRRQTASRVQKEGSRATLKVVVLGAPPPSLQWYFNGAAVERATNDTYTIPSVTPADAGSYWVFASNILGTASGPITVLGVNNVEPSAIFAGLLLSAPTGTRLQVQSAEMLGNSTLWQSIEDLTVPASPHVFIDLNSTNGNQHFYRTTQQDRIEPLLVSGWIYTVPVGSEHRIEYVDAQVGYTNWQFVTNLTLPSTPYWFIDRSVTNLVRRYYRTTPLP
jgi:hypothetical protein